MNSVSLTNTDLELHVLNEDYFALKVVNDSSVESTKYVEFCLDSLKREISSYATKFVKVEKDIDPVLNTFVYRGELLVCEPKGGGDAE